MDDRSNRRWVLSAIGIPLWIGAMVLTGIINDDPSDPTSTQVAFIAGGTIFFGLMFGMALWQQRGSCGARPHRGRPAQRPDPSCGADRYSS